jgi:hypothetical protein
MIMMTTMAVVVITKTDTKEKRKSISVNREGIRRRQQ